MKGLYYKTWTFVVILALVYIFFIFQGGIRGRLLLEGFAEIFKDGAMKGIDYLSELLRETIGL